MFADQGLNYEAGICPAPYGYRIEGSLDGKRWELLCDQTNNHIDRHIAYLTWAPQSARFVRLVATRIPAGMKLGVWEFTAFGVAQNLCG